MREIDLATWNRAMHCQIFRNSVQPQYCVTFELDITNFLRNIKKRGYSFTFSFVFAVTKCANEIEEFRCRFWRVNRLSMTKSIHHLPTLIAAASFSK